MALSDPSSDPVSYILTFPSDDRAHSFNTKESGGNTHRTSFGPISKAFICPPHTCGPGIQSKLRVKIYSKG